MRNALHETYQQIIDHYSGEWRDRWSLPGLPKPLPVKATVLEQARPGLAWSAPFTSALDEVLSAQDADSRQPIVVAAGSGAGKTVLLQWAAVELAKRNIQAWTRSVMPVYVDLAQVGHEIPDDNLSSIIDAQLARYHSFDVRSIRAGSTPFVVFLDGLDRLVGNLSAERLVDQAFNLARSIPSTRLVISTRLSGRLRHILDGRKWAASIELGPLDPESRDEWIENTWSQEACARYAEFIQSHYTMESFVSVPLLFAMVATVCLGVHRGENAIPPNTYPGPTGIIDGCLQFLVGRACRQGRLPSGTRFHEVSPIIEDVCFANACGFHRDTIRLTDLEHLFGQAREGLTNLTEEWRIGAQALLDSGIMVPTLDQSGYSFLTNQFHEYCAGRSLAHRLAIAYQQDVVEAETFGVARDRRLDPVLQHAVAILMANEGTAEVARRAMNLLATVDEAGAIEFVSKCGGRRAGEWLAGLVAHGQPSLAAIKALGRPQFRSSSPVLVALCQDERASAVSRLEAAQSLHRMGVAEPEEFFKVLCESNIKDIQIRVVATLRLASLSPSEAVPILKELIEHPDEDLPSEVREELITALAQHAPEDATRALGEYLLRHPDTGVDCHSVLGAFAEIMRQAGVERLQGLARDPRFAGAPRRRIEEFLHELVPDGVLPLPKKPHEDNHVAVSAPSREELATEHERLKQAIASFRTVAIDPTVGATTRFQAVDRLVALKPSTAKAVCLKISLDRNYATADRIHAIKNLRDLKYRGSRLTGLCHQPDEDDNVREMAALAVALQQSDGMKALTVVKSLFGGQLGLETMTKLTGALPEMEAIDLCTDKRFSDAARTCWIATLGFLGWTKSVPTLAKLCRDVAESPSIRFGALNALSILERSQAVRVAYQLIRSKSLAEELRRLALWVLYTSDPATRAKYFLLASVNSRSFPSDAIWEVASLVNSGSVAWENVESFARQNDVSDSVLETIAAGVDRRILPRAMVSRISEQIERRQRSRVPLGFQLVELTATLRRLEAGTDGEGVQQPDKAARDHEDMMEVYLIYCQLHDHEPSLRDAEEWSSGWGKRRSKSTLGKTKTWLRYQQITGSRREFRAEVRHEVRETKRTLGKVRREDA